jgi:hypothetical protein
MELVPANNFVSNQQKDLRRDQSKQETKVYQREIIEDELNDNPFAC